MTVQIVASCLGKIVKLYHNQLRLHWLLIKLIKVATALKQLNLFKSFSRLIHVHVVENMKKWEDWESLKQNTAFLTKQKYAAPMEYGSVESPKHVSWKRGNTKLTKSSFPLSFILQLCTQTVKDFLVWYQAQRIFYLIYLQLTLLYIL